MKVSLALLALFGLSSLAQECEEELMVTNAVLKLSTFAAHDLFRALIAPVNLWADSSAIQILSIGKPNILDNGNTRPLVLQFQLHFVRQRMRLH